MIESVKEYIQNQCILVRKSITKGDEWGISSEFEDDFIVCGTDKTEFLDILKKEWKEIDISYPNEGQILEFFRKIIPLEDKRVKMLIPAVKIEWFEDTHDGIDMLEIKGLERFDSLKNEK